MYNNYRNRHWLVLIVESVGVSNFCFSFDSYLVSKKKKQLNCNLLHIFKIDQKNQKMLTYF